MSEFKIINPNYNPLGMESFSNAEESNLKNIYPTGIKVVDSTEAIYQRLRTLKNRAKLAEAAIKIAENRLQIAEENCHVDKLTECYNRNYLERYTNEIFDPNRDDLVVALIDVDNLKEVNDKHKHHMGDALLKYAAETLKLATLRKSDMLIRMGGDEFLIIYEVGNYDKEELISVVENRLRAFRVNFANEVNDFAKKNGSDYKAGFSFGVTYFDKSIDECNLNNTIARADEIMYEDKSQKASRLFVENKSLSD